MLKSALSKYRIQTVAQMTGLSPALIRAWEARYGLVTPQRTESGYRLYSDEDVALLRGAQRLVAGGMAPMQVATLGKADILRGTVGQDAMAQAAAPPPPEREAAQGEAVLGRDRDREPPSPLFAERIEALIDAFRAFDPEQVDRLLGPAILALPIDIACHQLLLPLLREVGDRWHRGEISVAVEHFGSHLVRAKLLGFLETMRQRGGPRRVVCACGPGELHEIGLIMFALRAAGQGWEPIYLGANTPVGGLVEAVAKARPDLVALSLTLHKDGAALAALLAEVRAAVPAGVPIVVGGRGVLGQEDAARGAGCLTLLPSGRIDDLLRPAPVAAA